MTTTAEKIKVMQAFEDGETIQVKPNPDNEWLEARKDSDVLEWDWSFNDYRIKPPDPKPLECWVSIVGVAEALDDTKDLMAHWSKKEAEEQVYSWPHRLQHTAHMREVTPQDEQDRKDARRYRWLKENGYNDARVLWKNLSEWDGIIDKAMEQT